MTVLNNDKKNLQITQNKYLNLINTQIYTPPQKNTKRKYLNLLNTQIYTRAKKFYHYSTKIPAQNQQ